MNPSTFRKIFLFSVLAFGLGTSDSGAFARAGGGRSGGRGMSMSRRASPPAAAPRIAPQQRPSAPPPAQPQQAQPIQQQPAPPPAGGGFMRSLAGGIAGGMLGSMLFNSFGRGGMGGQSSGMGLFDLLVLAGVIYLGFRWWKARQQTEELPATDGTARYSSVADYQRPEPIVDVRQIVPESLNIHSELDTETAADVFFKIQTAWTRRDLSSVVGLLHPDLRDDLLSDLAELKAHHQINRLENIAIRKIELRDSWTELGAELATMRILANMLDYNVDETTGQIVEGSDTVPVKFEEDWTFKRDNGESSWKLASIGQIS